MCVNNQTNKVEESITKKSKCEKRGVVYEKTIIECELKKNASVEVMNCKEIILSTLSPKEVIKTNW